MTVILVSASYDHTIRFWEAPSGMCHKTIQFTDSQINALSISPDKHYIAAAGHHTVRLFEVNSNNPAPIHSLDSATNGHKLNITSLGWQRDARWLYTASEDSTIRIWDMRSLGVQRTFKCDAAVNSVSLHPNQAEILSADQAGLVRVWDLAGNGCVTEISPENVMNSTTSSSPSSTDVPMRSVSVASDGSVIVAANNVGNVFVWNCEKATSMANLGPMRKFRAHKSYVLKCLISPDSRQIATASADKTVSLWNLKDDKLIKQLKGHQRWVWDMAYSADSAYLVTASSDNTARLWDLSRGESIRQYLGHQKPVVAIALNDQSV